MNAYGTCTLAAFFIMAAGVFSAYAQHGAKPARSQAVSETERSVRSFFDSYAEDLRGHKREAIADRYDRRGVYMVGNGRKSFETFENVRDRYLNKWSGPKSFAWKDLSVEVLSKDAAVVTGLFEWQTATGATFNYSYTGLLLRRDGKWRIRLEDESTAPPKPSAN